MSSVQHERALAITAALLVVIGIVAAVVLPGEATSAVTVEAPTGSASGPTPTSRTPAPTPLATTARDRLPIEVARPSPEPSQVPSPSPPAEPTTAPSPTEAARTPTPTAAPTPPAAPARPTPWTLEVYRGWGMWVDVFDWSDAGSGGDPAVTAETIDQLAARGVQTVFIQTARYTWPDAVLERDRLEGLIDHMHGHGISVVGWYLPTFVDPEDDWRHVEAALGLDLDGFALDIESTEVEDAEVRTKRYLAMSRRLRSAVGGRVIAANTIAPIGMDLNPHAWPGFPWPETAELYDVVVPMAYFTFRGPSSGPEWRDAEAYTAGNARRARELTGVADLPVHVIGGIGDRTTPTDIDGMTRGARAAGVMGLSLYDVATTGSGLWKPMTAWRQLR